MMTTTEIDLMLFLLYVILGSLVYAVLGLVVLIQVERDPIAETITNPIEGWRAWCVFLAWPLTAPWLIWRAWCVRRRWHHDG